MDGLKPDRSLGDSLRRRRVVLCWLMLVAFVATGGAGVVEAQRALPLVSPRELGFSVTHWTVEHGLPEQTVTSLAQTPDGYLWCGTYSGLVRYDGKRFKVFDYLNTPALNEVQIGELSCDSKGRLWIEGASGELVVYENGRFQRVGEQEGLPLHQAGNMVENLEGGFWVKDISDGRFHHYRKGRFETVDVGIPASAIDRFIASSRGLEWAECEKERTLIRFTTSGPELQPLVAPDGEPETTLGRFFHLPNGALAVTSSHGIYACCDSRWRLQTCFPRTVGGRALDGVEDWDGNCWVSFSGVGLVICQPDGRMGIVTLPEQSKSPFIRALMLDAEGNVWAAGDDGLYRIRHEAFRAQPGLAETLKQAANAVVEDSQGSVWILFQKGMARLRRGRWEYLANPDANANIATGAPSRDGGLYVAYADFDTHENFLEKITAGGERNRIAKLNGLVHVILERRNGELWVGTDTGIWRRQNGCFQRVPLTLQSGDYVVYAMIEDKADRIIASAFRRGLFRQEENGTWRRLTTKHDVGSDFVRSLYLDDENTLWAATDRGLARWKNASWYAYSNADGMLPGWVRGVVSDKHGALWLSSQFGVARADRSILNAIADGQNHDVDVSWFDRSDGLPSISCSVDQRAVERSADGRIWVATAKGAAVVDPAAWIRRRDRVGAPRVHMETMLADDKSVWTLGPGGERTEAARCLVPPGVRRLEFRYTAIDLTANRKSHFRYRLEGYDKNWVDAGDRRSVVYHWLSPGNYRFQVAAENSYGLWNSPGESVLFTVEPHWWETLWFRMGAGMFVVGLLWFSRSVKARQLRWEKNRCERFARQLIQSQEAERKRIAGELHDGLGQDLLAAKNMALIGSVKPPSAAEIGQRFKEISDTLGDALREVRGISRGLRPAELDCLGLTKAIRALLQRLDATTQIEVKSDIRDVDGLLAPDDEINFYRLTQESLNNVIRHSDASCLHCCVTRDADLVSATISDDGKGFDITRTREEGKAGLGLLGMEERAKLMGGQLEIHSAPGHGTRLSVTIPVMRKSNE